ncbi:hypothetical protein BDZ45DRAFT_649306 [Acephala macrosclerotiorum]|nr:hypothetical protein BDZ45DRAFT_649306 [Acephala macrosclerotiorum]
MAGRKRKSPPDSPDGIYSNKSRSQPSAEARVDPTYGQRSAIPGLDDGNMFGEDDDSLLYDEDMDALAYLRSVRQEAFGIPNLLVAPKQEEDERDIYEDGVGDFRGRYEDGAYLAAANPMSEDSQNTSEEEEKDPQVAYFDSIISRYEDLRSRLAQTPPINIAKSLDSDHPTQVGPLNKVLTRWWIKNMRLSDPKPAQVACMSKSSVLRLLRLLTQGSLLKRGSQVEFGVSYWVWSLLAKLPDRGLLNSEEIGVVRELGKKAVLVGMGLNEAEEWKEGMQDVEAQFEENLGGEEDTARNNDEIDLELEDDISEKDYPVVNVEEAADSQTTDTSSQILPVGLDPLGVDGDTEHPVSASSQTLMADGEPAVTAENDEDPSDGEILSNNDGMDDAKALAVMKARMLGRLSSPQSSVKVEPEASTPKPRPPPSKLNTRATVDMILTVAGEIYGQRDLLEFRSEWAHIM